MSGGNEKVLQLSGATSASTEAYFQRLARLIPQLPYGALESIARTLIQAFAEDASVFVFGNGGSAAAASHMMADMSKGTAESGRQGGLKVIALTDNVPLLTAWANDYGYEHVFSEQLKTLARPRDVAFAISGSGNSPNVLLALETARDRGAITVGLTGYGGGRMQALCDVCAIVPCDDMQMIEDVHSAMLHSIFTVVRKRIVACAPHAVAAAAGRSRK